MLQQVAYSVSGFSLNLIRFTIQITWANKIQNNSAEKRIQTLSGIPTVYSSKHQCIVQPTELPNLRDLDLKFEQSVRKTQKQLVLKNYLVLKMKKITYRIINRGPSNFVRAYNIST